MDGIMDAPRDSKRLMKFWGDGVYCTESRIQQRNGYRGVYRLLATLLKIETIIHLRLRDWDSMMWPQIRLNDRNVGGRSGHQFKERTLKIISGRQATGTDS